MANQLNNIHNTSNKLASISDHLWAKSNIATINTLATIGQPTPDEAVSKFNDLAKFRSLVGRQSPFYIREATKEEREAAEKYDGLKVNSNGEPIIGEGWVRVQ